MRIQDSNATPIGSRGLEKTDGAEATGRSRGRGAELRSGGGDSVELSSLGSQLARLTADSPERAARLEQLAADVASGRYQVDAQAVSQRLLDDSLGNVP